MDNFCLWGINKEYFTVLYVSENLFTLVYLLDPGLQQENVASLSCSRDLFSTCLVYKLFRKVFRTYIIFYASSRRTIQGTARPVNWMFQDKFLVFQRWDLEHFNSPTFSGRFGGCLHSWSRKNMQDIRGRAHILTSTTRTCAAASPKNFSSLTYDITACSFIINDLSARSGLWCCDFLQNSAHLPSSQLRWHNMAQTNPEILYHLKILKYRAFANVYTTLHPHEWTEG